MLLCKNTYQKKEFFRWQVTWSSCWVDFPIMSPFPVQLASAFPASIDFVSLKHIGVRSFRESQATAKLG